MAQEITEIKIKHLEMIQDVITRLNGSSFQFKGWCIVVLSALLALFANSGNELFILVAIFPAIIFWIVDSFYLENERAFRLLYNDVINEESEVTPFSMGIKKYKGYKLFFKSFFSATEIWFYASCIVLLIVLFLLIYNCITFEIINKNA